MTRAAELSQKAISAELEGARFLAGSLRKRWRLISYEYPIMFIGVSNGSPEDNSKEYVFRFELTDFPSTAPDVRIWDLSSNNVLAKDKRPKGSQRVNEAFKEWNEGNIYRPWERTGVTHNNWIQDHPELTWHSNRGLIFILEDLHGLISSSDMALVAQG